MDIVNEADVIVRSLRYRIFGIGEQEAISLYNKAIFHLTLNSQYDEVINVHRKLMMIEPHKKRHHLSEIRKLKPKDISITEEFVRYIIEEGENPYSYYKDLADNLNSVEYYKKAYKFANDTSKEYIRKRLHELSPAFNEQELN